MTYQPWMETARCAQPDVDPDWWHSPFWRERRQAAKFCGRCPVLSECATYAAAEKTGVWAGTDRTYSQRRSRRAS